MERLKSYLKGEWVDGEGEGATLFDPSTGEAIATASTAGLDFAGAFAFAKEHGGPALRAMSFAERGAMLKAMSKALYAKREELIASSLSNAGTTRGDAKFDIDGATGTLAYYASLGKRLGDKRFLVEGEGEQLTQSARFWGHHVRLPLQGVAVHVNAFNFPAWGLAEKAAVALLAGVPVITKPGTATALVAHRCMEILAEVEELPKGALQFVCGNPGDLLSHLGSQDALAFTGSAATGNKLRSLENVLGQSVRVNVEADSLNAAVLGKDVEVGSDTWHLFIKDTAREITQKTGQKCTATRRIFVPEDRLEQVQEALSEEIGRVRFGAPGQDGVRVGPLASAQQLRDVKAGLATLLEGGAELVFDPETEFEGATGEGFYFGPKLLVARKPFEAEAVHNHEVFGPVSTIMPYESNEDAAALVALGRGGLVASVYSDDREVVAALVLGLAPWSGRVLVGSRKIVGQGISPGMVLPSCVHGGPGRAGGGEELGGERGLAFYTQRTSIQGDRALLDRVLGLR